MAATPVLSYPQTAVRDELDLHERRASMDSILGTMAAEGEFPSEQILALMNRYADGHMTHDELMNAMFTYARRTAHEAATGGHAV